MISEAPGREFFAVPEKGPFWMVYDLHAFPGSREQAKVRRSELEKVLLAGVAEAEAAKKIRFPLTRRLHLSRLGLRFTKSNPSHKL